MLVTHLRESCPGALRAQVKGEKLMVVPSTPMGSELRSAHCGPSMLERVTFHKLMLSEDRCVWLLVNKAGKVMPVRVVRQDLESLNIHAKRVTQLRSGRRDQDPDKDGPPTPQFIVSAARGPEVLKVRSLMTFWGFRVSFESYVAPKGPLQCKRCQRFGHTQRNCGYASRCVACMGSHVSGGCCTPQEQPECCACRRNHTANYWGCIKWKEAKAALAKQAPERGRKSAATGQPAASKSQSVGTSAELMDLGDGLNHVVGRGISSKPPPQHPQMQIPLLSRSLKRQTA